MALIEEAHKAARTLLDHAYVRLVARAEPDAVCAAALLGHALRRENVDFHVTWTPRVTEALAASLAEERNDCLVLIGLSGDSAVADVVAARKVVIDRSQGAFPAEATLDPRHASESTEAGLASLAHLVAVAMSKRNRDLAPLAVTGALAAGRHVGGFRGLDAEVLSEAVDAGLLLQEPALGLHGPTLLQALGQMDSPFVAGVTGRARNVKKLVADLKLSSDAPPASLAEADAERLGSFLTLRLLAQGAPDAALDALYRPTLRGLQGPHTGLEAGELARAVEAACAASRSGLGFAALWPDSAAGAELIEIAAQARDELVAALLRAERDARAEGGLHVVDAPREGLCAPLALRVALSLCPAGRVAVARHAGPEGTTFALRAFHAANLAHAARHAAQAVGGHSWGDAREARLWAPAAEADRALKALAEALA